MKLLIIKKFKKNFFDLKKDPFKILLLAVLIAGFSLRVLGVYPGYSPYHPDEGKAGYSSAWYMFVNRTLDLPHYHYPALIPLIELVFLSFVFIPILWVKLLVSSPNLVLSNLDKLPEIFQNYIALRSDILIMFLSRYLMVVFGFLTLICVYFTSKLLFSSRLVGLFAALVLAVNLRAVTSSQLDLPDGYSGFFLILAFYVLSKLKNNPSLRFYILSAVSIGLVISTKLQFFSFLPFLILHFYQVMREKTTFSKLSTLFSKKIFFWVLFLILTLVLINIGPLSHFQKFYETMSRQSNLYGFGINRFGMTGLSYFYQIVLTPGIAIVIIIGVLVGLLKYKLSTVLVLSVVIFYAYYFLYLTRGWFYPRNFVSILPFFAILAGLGLASIWNMLNHYIKNGVLATIFFVIIISLVLMESTKNSLIHTINYMKPWNITTMRSCLDKNTAEGKTVAAHPTDKYILFSLPSIDESKKLNFIPVDINSSYSLAELRAEKAGYALVGLDVVGDSNSVWWMARPQFWNKPSKVAENVFAALAAKELFQNTVCSAVKPWQAVENNYVFVRIPRQEKLGWNQIQSFGFDSEVVLPGWKKVDGFLGKGDNLTWDGQEGRKDEGSLKIKTVTPVLPVVRWVSPIFTVKPGSVYKAAAFIKSSTNVDKTKRDGFLRLDFYEKEPAVWNEETLGLSNYLSSRYFGEGEWQAKEVIGVAPKRAKFASLSFQVSAPSAADFWLDDVMIYESESKNTPHRANTPSFWFIPDKDVLVPNLGSNY